MKLRSIAEGFWTLPPGKYPNSLVKSIPKADDTGEEQAQRHSPLLHPNDRERFIRWGYDKQTTGDKNV